MNEQLKARIRELAEEISTKWDKQGTPIREFGTRDGDGDRGELADEIWSILTEQVSLDEDPDIISDTLTEWHRARG